MYMSRGKKNGTVGLYPIVLAQVILREYNDKNENKYNNINTR